MKQFGEDIPVRKFMPIQDETLFGGEGARNPYKIWAKDQFKPIRDGEIISTEGWSLQAGIGLSQRGAPLTSYHMQ